MSASNAAGEKSRSFMAHPGQRSTTVAVTDFPWTIEKVHVKKLLDQWELEKYIQFAVMRFPQRGLLRQIINERALINVWSFNDMHAQVGIGSAARTIRCQSQHISGNLHMPLTQWSHTSQPILQL